MENLSTRKTRNLRDWIACIPVIGDVVNHNDALEQREIMKKMAEATKTNFQKVDSEIHLEEDNLKRISKILEKTTDSIIKNNR